MELRGGDTESGGTTNMYSIFVYGTLMDRSVRDHIVGRPKVTYSGTLLGYKKVGLNIIEDPHSQVEGVYFEVNDEELARLDSYESIDTGLYKRIEVEIEGVKHIAYQKGDPETKINLEY